MFSGRGKNRVGLLLPPSLLSLSIAAGGAAHADAAGLYDPSPFTGPYVGAQVGYDSTEAELDFDIGGVAGTVEADDDGIQGGVYAGYSAVVERLFGAVEVEASLSAVEDKGFTLGASALAGFLPHERVVLYGRLGYAYTEFEVDGNEGFDGLRVGAGVDVAIHEDVSARVEYAYTDYGDMEIVGGADSVSLDLREHLVRAGIAYRF